MNQEIGKYLVLIGLLLFVAGVIIYYGGEKLNWIGNLPGDIRIQGENYRVYFPITSLILFSLLINVLLRIWKYFS